MILIQGRLYGQVLILGNTFCVSGLSFNIIHQCLSHGSQWTSQTSAIAASAPKPAFASDSIGQLLHHDDIGRVDALDDELRDSVPLLDGKIGVAKVEQNDLERAAVVGVDDAGASVDAVLCGEAGAWGDPPVYLLLLSVFANSGISLRHRRLLFSVCARESSRSSKTTQTPRWEGDWCGNHTGTLGHGN
jgi:hypothetical protein